MNLKRLGKNWDAWGKSDPMYAVLTDPSKRHGGWQEDEFFANGRAEIADVMAYLDGVGVTLGHDAALDFGCGVGRLTQAMAPLFDTVVGVDIAPSMIERANGYNRFPDRCRYRVNATSDLSQFADASFDFVYCNIVLQHMEPVYAHAYVREFFRVLRPGGVTVFFLPEAPVVATARRSLSGRTKEAVRYLLNGAAYRLTGRVVLPGIDMYGTPRQDVERLVSDSNGELVGVTSDLSAGSGWTGYRYTCRRR